MILADASIERALRNRALVIDPLLEPIQSASVDLRLGDRLLKPSRGLIHPGVLEVGGQVETPESFKFYSLSPGEFVNVCTLEWVEIPPDLIGILTGKSSLARLGLQVECAGYVDPGWKGRLTLELCNLGPSMIVLRPAMKICQIRFEVLSSTPQHLYGDPALNSHYQGSEGPVGARFTEPEEDPDG